MKLLLILVFLFPSVVLANPVKSNKIKLEFVQAAARRPGSGNVSLRGWLMEYGHIHNSLPDPGSRVMVKLILGFEPKTVKSIKVIDVNARKSLCINDQRQQWKRHDLFSGFFDSSSLPEFTIQISFPCASCSSKYKRSIELKVLVETETHSYYKNFVMADAWDWQQ